MNLTDIIDHVRPTALVGLSTIKVSRIVFTPFVPR